MELQIELRLFSCNRDSSSSAGTSEPMLESGNIEVSNLDDARKMIKDLKHRYRSQAQQLLAWRRAHKIQEDLVLRLQMETSDQLKVLSSKLLLFESRLVRKQKDISALLNHREAIIYRQQRIIETLTNRLIENGIDTLNPDLTDLDANVLDLDSLNDSDSAVIMEDIDSDSTISVVPRFRSSSADSITVMRSISDAIDPSLKYSSMRRSNGFLRRPEVLETVYSVEEDVDIDNGSNSDGKASVSQKRESFAASGKTVKLGNDEVINDSNHNNSNTDTANTEDNEPIRKNPMTTYNRVMSNHRSVTKPKDVKYKRINKAKSKSLEELRGRLKNWVDHGNNLTELALEHSHSYA